MKAADIPDEVMADAVAAARRPGGEWANRSDVEVEVSRRLGRDVPAKVTLAKARKLIRRGVLDGCACGCRGDWSVAQPDG